MHMIQPEALLFIIIWVVIHGIWVVIVRGYICVFLLALLHCYMIVMLILTDVIGVYHGVPSSTNLSLFS